MNIIPKHGDVLSCYSDSLLQRAIRFVTRGQVGHTARVIEIGSQLYVVDSQRDGTNIKLYGEWQKKFKYEYIIHRPIFPEYKWQEKLEKMYGMAPYDFASLLLFQPLYIITGVWIGRTKEKAIKRPYCSEAIAYSMGHPKFWLMSPQALFDYMEGHTNYYQVIEESLAA